MSVASRLKSASRDAAGLQALAADAARTLAPPQPPANRRGPLRPQKLVSSRARNAGRLAVRFFSAADMAVIVLLAITTAAAAIAGPLLAAPVRSVLPLTAATAVAIWAVGAFGLYGFGRSERLAVHLLKLAGAFGLAGVAGLAVDLLTGGAGAGALGLVIWLALSFMTVHMLHVWWWATVRAWRRNGKLTPNVVVVGATRHAERLIKAAMARRDVNVIGVFDDRLSRNPDSVGGVPVLGDTASLLNHRITPYVDRVVVALDPSAKGRVRELTDRLRVLPNEVSLLVDLESEEGRAAALTRLADAPLARVSGHSEDDRAAWWKRVQDLAIGSAALVLLAPAMLVIALLVKLSSPGPVFFRQVRQGFNNEEFRVWKFRTMRVETASGPTEIGKRKVRQVETDDPRVTRVGRFLRLSSLDELPQLFNVLRGEMSLVGPRPHAVGTMTGEEETATLIKEYAHRHRIKPGMTGWAAIKGSRGPLHEAADVKRRVALDIEYIERQSFWLDLYIMAMTVPCLLGDRQAVR
ncbi:MAG: exopolysaccharide biosynthesis polyprenyl glycosylphosphotransferase [Caulobacteraceae bacterium]|nr:exopolysaccharide biosynthesis polyprenyl glycosylphosphotransferase [Caulobacteraceae bacterium]